MARGWYLLQLIGFLHYGKNLLVIRVCFHNSRLLKKRCIFFSNIRIRFWNSTIWNCMIVISLLLLSIASVVWGYQWANSISDAFALMLTYEELCRIICWTKFMQCLDVSSNSFDGGGVILDWAWKECGLIVKFWEIFLRDLSFSGFPTVAYKCQRFYEGFYRQKYRVVMHISTVFQFLHSND